MNLRDKIYEAVINGNAKAALHVVVVLRNRGANYDLIYRTVNGVKPISKADWDELIYEGENR